MAYNTTATLEKLSGTDYLVLRSVKGDLDDFLSPKMTPTSWILNWKCLREKVKMQNFDWDKTLQWEKLISISLFTKEIN